MALTLENINNVKNRTLRGTLPSKAQFALRAFYRDMNDNYGNPQLQQVIYGALVATDVVICSGACTLYAIYYKKPAASTGPAILKMMDHASAVTQATPDYAIPMLNADEQVLVWPSGQVFTTGLTIQANTTSTGSTLPAAGDRPTGWFIIGA